ncbi:MAG: helix-turn-helix domain-containing protein [Solirubrobacteraceae bacterium]
MFAGEGHSNAEIARRLGISTKAIGRWRSRFAERRLAGLEDQARSGRPRRFPPARGRAGQGGRGASCPTNRASRWRGLVAPSCTGFVVERGVSEASASTIGRWLAEDAIRPRARARRRR